MKEVGSGLVSPVFDLNLLESRASIVIGSGARSTRIQGFAILML